MKNRLKLTSLSKKELERMKGGYIIYGDENHVCGCGCYWAGSDGSSTDDNKNANYSGGKYSPPKR